MLESQKKREIWKIIFLHKSPFKRSFKHRIHSLGELMPEAALTSFAVSNAYRQFAGQAAIGVLKYRLRIEYSTPTNNI